MLHSQVDKSPPWPTFLSLLQVGYHSAQQETEQRLVSKKLHVVKVNELSVFPVTDLSAASSPPFFLTRDLLFTPDTTPSALPPSPLATPCPLALLNLSPLPNCWLLGSPKAPRLIPQTSALVWLLFLLQ